MVGFSNGGMMTYRFASERGDLLAAAAPLAANLGGRAHPDANEWRIGEPKKPLPLLVMHGMDDNDILYEGGRSLHRKSERTYCSVDESIDFWLGSNGCVGQPVDTTMAGGAVSVRTWNDCKHSAMIINTKSETVKQNFTFKNDRQGFDKLLDELEPYADQLMIALEATGHYWLSLYEVLTTAGYQVVVLNPLQVHAYQRSGIRKRKNDRIDSFWIADFARISNLQATPQQATEHLQLRDLSRFRFRLTENMGNSKRL